MVCKEEIRTYIKGLLSKMDREDKERRSQDVRERILSFEIYRDSKNILGFFPKEDEVDISELLRNALREKILYLPKMRGDSLEVYRIRDLSRDLEDSLWGIKEPKEDCPRASVDDMDLILVPGVAFDLRKNRLGRGKGYYDRFLKDIPPQTTKIGVCFSFQLLESLPVNSRDIRVDFVITDREVI